MNATEFEKVTLSDMQNLKIFADTFTAYDKCYVLNIEYLLHTIHMQIPQKQRPLCECFSEFLKSRLNFEHIEKKGDTHS